MGGIGGVALGLITLRWKQWPVALAACFSAATLLHFGWDWIALSSPADELTPAQIGGGAVLMLAGFLLYGGLATLASAQSRAVFEPKSSSRLWGWPFAGR
jgi:hypothetical protein